MVEEERLEESIRARQVTVGVFARRGSTDERRHVEEHGIRPDVPASTPGVEVEDRPWPQHLVEEPGHAEVVAAQNRGEPSRDLVQPACPRIIDSVRRVVVDERGSGGTVQVEASRRRRSRDERRHRREVPIVAVSRVAGTGSTQQDPQRGRNENTSSVPATTAGGPVGGRGFDAGETGVATVPGRFHGMVGCPLHDAPGRASRQRDGGPVARAVRGRVVSSDRTELLQG